MKKELIIILYRDGQVETNTYEVEQLPDGRLNQHDVNLMESELRSRVSGFDRFGAGWIDPETHEIWEYGAVNRKFILSRLGEASDCCGARVTGSSNGIGRCDECKEGCGVIYYTD